jgi:hypothetical protein
LGRDFPPELRPVAHACFPPLKDRGGKGVKSTLVLATGLDVRRCAPVEPVPHGARTDAQASGNGLRGQSLAPQGERLVIAAFSLGPPRGHGLLHLPAWSRTPFLHRDGMLL